MAVINTLTPTPGFFPNALLTISGTGFGGIAGRVFLVLQEAGNVLEIGYIDWSDTTIHMQFPDADSLLNDFNVVVPAAGYTSYIVVLPTTSTVGASSTTFTFEADTTPITSFAHDTLILGGPTSTVEGDEGPVPAPVQLPLSQPIGRIDSFDNPGYDVKWSIDFQFSSASGGFDQTDFSVVGATVEAMLTNLGISIPFIGDE